MASKRQGTHKTKERNEIIGSRKKLKRQKGTGTARFGDIKNPIFRGGGRIFGPKPRNYDFKLNKKVKILARNSALSHKAKASNIIIVEDLSFDAPKTNVCVIARPVESIVMYSQMVGRILRGPRNGKGNKKNTLYTIKDNLNHGDYDELFNSFNDYWN